MATPSERKPRLAMRVISSSIWSWSSGSDSARLRMMCGAPLVTLNWVCVRRSVTRASLRFSVGLKGVNWSTRKFSWTWIARSATALLTAVSIASGLSCRDSQGNHARGSV